MRRSGFGLMQALMVIVLISGLMMVVMKYAKYSIKQTKDLYVRESAELFMNSAVELGLLAISGYERNSTSKCLSQISIISKDRRFKADINVTDYFLYDTNGSSDDYDICSAGSGTDTYKVHKVSTEESNGMVIFEVVVETNASHPKNSGIEVRLLRRTLQRP